MTFGGQCDERTSHAILDKAFAAGVTFIDTADVYPLAGGIQAAGTTERIVGTWLKGKREQVIIASKGGYAVGPRPWDQGNTRKHLLDAIDGTLRRLGTDYVDVYYLHRPDATPVDETLEALDTIVRSGRARYIGCSNYLAYQIAVALGRSDLRGLARFACVQPRYNLLYRAAELELFPLCQAEGLAVITFNPLAGGLLTGKHDRSRAPESGRFKVSQYQDRYWHDREFDAVGQLAPFAQQAGVSLATLAVAWTLANPLVTAPIIGASSPEQLDATLAAAEWQMPAEVKMQLDAISAPFRLSAALF